MHFFVTVGKYVRMNKRNYSLFMIIFVCLFGVEIIGGGNRNGAWVIGEV